MTQGPDRRPTHHDARSIAARYLGHPPTAVARFATGTANYVFDVLGDAGERCVVRIGVDREAVAHAVAWHRLLASTGVPLPTLLASDAADDGDTFPYMILERLPGADLDAAYPSLTSAQKRALAIAIVRIQRRVAALPRGRGYGYARSYDDPSLHRTWAAVLLADLDRSRRRIATVGEIDARVVDRVARKLPAYASYLETVRPIPFLDDTTTKNVLVADGKLSGIVDVDVLCFGDPLLTPALTQMALLSHGYRTDYIDEWCAAMGVTDEQRTILTLYTALFCVNFMGEIGHRFNKEVAAPVGRERVDHLHDILDRLARGC